jgi:RimJ/RimL family protein N-acetyltransferase
MSHNRILTESEALFLIRDGIKSLGSQDRLLDKARFNFGVYFNNELIGTVSIQHSQQTSVVYHTKTNKPKGFWVSISYAFLPEAWGQHLASEAVARVVRFAFQDTFIGGIHGASARANLGSQGVLKNNGFIQIAYDEHPTFIHFALSRHQWLNR